MAYFVDLLNKIVNFVTGGQPVIVVSSDELFTRVIVFINFGREMPRRFHNYVALLFSISQVKTTTSLTLMCNVKLTRILIKGIGSRLKRGILLDGR